MAREMIILKSEAEYERALDEIEKFFEAEPRPGTPEAQRFNELARALAAYERENWAIADKTASQVDRAQARRMFASGTSGRDRTVYRTPDGWANKRNDADRPSSVHRTKGEAERAAHRNLSNQGGGELTIKGRDGQIRSKDTVPPGNDPTPPRDRKH